MPNGIDLTHLASGPSQPPQGSLPCYVLRLYFGPREHQSFLASPARNGMQHLTLGETYTLSGLWMNTGKILSSVFRGEGSLVLFLLKGHFRKGRLTGDTDNIKVSVKLCSGFLRLFVAFKTQSLKSGASIPTNSISFLSYSSQR